ncbi:DUF2163 domain-containing protein [Hyphococcus sp. DH-69]|uniref:DUF2163 domain-containing protein n=1 Tax=Hyphococcus formosus TaxID=3143534 RepID=UPI00398B73AC
MRALDSQFAAHLAGGATTLATCWRIVRRDETVLGFTDHDRPLAFLDTIFRPETGANGSAMNSSADLGADNAEIEGLLSSVEGEDLRAGRYDGAGIEIYRVNWAQPSQHVLLKAGTIGEVTHSGSQFRAELRGLSHALDQPTGRIYQRLCDVNFASAQCGAGAPFVSASVAMLRDDQNFIADGLSGYDDGWFAHGLLRWTSGGNAGLTGFVKSQSSGGAISLWLPAGAAIELGDEFEVQTGCDKRFSTCRDKFSNQINFRGFPTMPGNDAAISYPLRSETNDGGRRA